MSLENENICILCKNLECPVERSLDLHFYCKLDGVLREATDYCDNFDPSVKVSTVKDKLIKIDNQCKNLKTDSSMT